MKLTRRLLAVVLAVAMLLGMVAVGATASITDYYEYDPVDNPYTGKIGLKAYKVNTDDGTYTEITDGAVEPGDVVRVEIWVQTNYFNTLGCFGIAYSNGLYVPTQLDYSTYSYLEKPGAVSYSKVFAMTEYDSEHADSAEGTIDNPYYLNEVVMNATSGYVGKTKTQNYANIKKYMPPSWRGTGNTATTYYADAKYTAYNYLYAFYQADANYSSAPYAMMGIIATEYQPTLYFNLTISPDAQNGDSGIISIPAEGIYTSTQTASTYLARCYSADEDGNGIGDEEEAAAADGLQYISPVNNNIAKDTYGTDATIYERVYDMSEATLTLTVGGGSTEPETTEPETETTTEADASYAKVEAAIAAIPADLSGYTKASVDAVNAAKNAVVYGLKASEQERVDAFADAINEAVKNLVPLGECDYDALDKAIAAYEAKVADKANYANWAEYEAAYDAAKKVARGMIADEAGANQKAIDDAAAALNAVVLVLKDASYAKVEAAIAAIPADLSGYTKASVDAVNAAKNAVVYGLDITKQAEVDAYADAINEAVKNLAPLGACDYTALDAQIKAYEELVKADYKPSSWDESGVDAAYAAAKEIAPDMIADEAGENQAAIDAAAEALADAIAALEKVANKEALAAAIAEAKGLNEEDYTPGSWEDSDIEAMIAEAEAVYADADASDDDVADAIANLAFAKSQLTKKADKSALADAIAAAKELKEENFTPDSWAEADLEMMIEEAEGWYNDENADADDIAQALEALENAVAALVEKADKSELDAAINTEVDLENVTADSLEAYNLALEAALAVFNDPNATKEEVEAAEIALLAAIANLAPLGACDYEEYDAAVAAAAALVEDEYTTSSWTAADVAAVVAANVVEKDLVADEAGENQAAIDAAAAAINAAIAKLEKKADMAKVEAALAAEPTVAEEYATEETWKDYAAAKAAAEAVLAAAADTGVSAQDDVDAAAAALEEANAALVEAPADYAAVEAAIAKIPADLSIYTQASVKAVEDAVAAVDYTLGKSKQEEVEAMAAAIEEAIGNLKENKAAITALEVDLEGYLKKSAKEYKFTVNGAPSKIQVKGPNGSTSTYDRYNSRVTIVSYNAAGEVIDYLDEEPAYEEWTIVMSLGEGDFTAKAKFDTTWEPEAFDFTVTMYKPREVAVTFVAKDSASEEEAGKALTLKRKGVAEITVTAPVTVTKVQLVFASGSTSTYTATHSAVTYVDNGDGTATWIISRAFGTAGTGSMTLKLKDASGWYDAVTDIITLEVVK